MVEALETGLRVTPVIDVSTDPSTAADGWYVDDISVAESPTVVDPPILDQITSHSMRLTWARCDDLLFSHIGYSIRNAVRAFALGLSFGKFASVPHDRKTAKYYQKLTRYSAALAFVSDVSMLVLGGKLKQKEHLSARLGDVLSLLYIASAMLKRYEAQGRPAALDALAWVPYPEDRRKDAFDQVYDEFKAWTEQARQDYAKLGTDQKAAEQRVRLQRVGHLAADQFSDPGDFVGCLLD